MDREIDFVDFERPRALIIAGSVSLNYIKNNSGAFLRRLPSPYLQYVLIIDIYACFNILTENHNRWVHMFIKT